METTVDKLCYYQTKFTLQIMITVYETDIDDPWLKLQVPKLIKKLIKVSN